MIIGKTSLISHSGGGAGAPVPGVSGMIYRRAFPENFVVGAPSANLLNPVGYAAPAWLQHLSVAQFGANPRWLCNIIWTPAIPLAGVGALGVTTLHRNYVIDIGSGLPAAPPVLIHRVLDEAHVYANVVTADPGTVYQLISFRSNSHPVGPTQFPGNTGVSHGYTKQDAIASQHRFWSFWYPDPLPVFGVIAVPGLPDGHLVLPTLADAAPVSGGGVGVYGAYVDIFPGPAFTSPARYLAVKTEARSNSSAGFNFAQEWGIGNPGAEVVHARSGFSAPTAGILPGGTYRFWPPWEIQVGDRVRVRTSGQVLGAGHDTTIELRAV